MTTSNTDERNPLTDTDYPLLSAESEAAYWRREAVKAASKVRRGLCVAPACTRSMEDTGWTCGDEACVDYVTDDLPALEYWSHFEALVIAHRLDLEGGNEAGSGAAMVSVLYVATPRRFALWGLCCAIAGGAIATLLFAAGMWLRVWVAWGMPL